MGLGLATALGVVAQAGGELHLSSSPGSGTTVLISLPVPANVRAEAASTLVTKQVVRDRPPP